MTLQGTLVGKVLTKADVEHCRVVLPLLAMEANMPEVVDAATLHVVSLHPLLVFASAAPLLMAKPSVLEVIVFATVPMVLDVEEGERGRKLLQLTLAATLQP